MKAGDKRVQTVRLELIRCGFGDSSDVGVKVIQTTRADVGDILQANSTENRLTIS